MAGKSGGDVAATLGKLVLLLAVLAGAGTWNYRRNIEAENAKPRPYRSYSDAQLADLHAAYKAQVDALASRYDTASSRRARAGDAQLLGEAVVEFEGVQRASRAVRDLGSRLSQEQASLRAIEQEKALRARMGGPTTQFLRRVFVPAV